MATLRWLARVFGLDGTSHDDDFASFEHVDGSRMAANEFHQSDSMRLDDAHLPDFTETLPAYSGRSIPPATRSPRPAAALRRALSAGQHAH
ncbi:MAG TPA: hypothetical protein VLJ62_15455 [Burkholderiaceae bacterium]|nr:hypothetical protein [Burkholderiaceae bacterium]